MANRHLSRSLALQTLFEWDFNSREPKMAGDILVRLSNEFAPGLGDNSFALDLTTGVVSKKETLDEIITRAAPEWPIDRISIVDRNVLRIGLHELLFGDRSDVPPKVAINEAIELAKSFGGENSSRFVNGVLGAIYKEMGEPGKDEISKRKKMELDPASFPLEKLVGAVVYAWKGADLYLAFVHDIFGHWTLSKGHLKENESPEDGVVRKVKEELGVDVVTKDKIGENEYLANNKEKNKIRKHVAYYTAEGNLGKLTTGGGGGLDDSKWFPVAEVVDLNIYDDIIPIITKGIELLKKNNK